MDGKRECFLCGFYITDHETIYMDEDEAFVCTKLDNCPKSIEKKLVDWLEALEEKESDERS